MRRSSWSSKAVSLQLTPSGKATWPEPRNTFRKTNVKGRDRGQSLLSRPQAALPGLAQQPRARRTDGQPPGSHSGNIHSYCRWANRRILLSLENILETPMKKTCFSDWLMGLKRDSCLPGSGRTRGPGKVSRPRLPPPRSAAPRPLSRAQPAARPTGHPLPTAPTRRTGAAATTISYNCH